MRASYFGISGIPSSVLMAEEIAQQAAGRTQDALVDIQAWLTTKVRAAAAQHPEWSSLAGDIHVTVDRHTGQISVGVPGPRAAEADALEHGTMDSPPVPFLRPLMAQLAHPAAQRLSRAMRF